MLVVAIIVVPVALLAAGARARTRRIGWLLVGLGVFWLIGVAVLATLALPAGGVEGGVSAIETVQP
jgi:hypothetical protein